MLRDAESTGGTSSTGPDFTPDARGYDLHWGAIFAVWSLPALVASYSTYVSAGTQGHAIPFWRALAMECPGWYVWVPLTPIVFALARRFPIVRRPDARTVGVHVGMMIIATILYSTVYVWSSVEFRSSPLTLSRAVVESVFVGSVVMTLVLYAATLATSLALDYAKRDRERERRTLALEAQLARAELHSLRAQLHPHVLFNALHTIALLARRDANEAIRVTVLLGNVLRSVLDSGGTDERPLREEISLIEQYLAIELVRFADRLEVVWEVDPETQDAMVPTLLLQPLVENALRHGIARSVNGGMVVVSAMRDGDAVCINVWNDGPSLLGGRVGRRGVGLRNTEERLHRLYGQAGRLTITNDARGGVNVRVCLPWRKSDIALGSDAEPSVLVPPIYARYDIAGETVPDLVVAPTPNR
ncbi:MAG TPA: histidine kinase [Gemmatimonadaceae bacterium]